MGALRVAACTLVSCGSLMSCGTHIRAKSFSNSMHVAMLLLVPVHLWSFSFAQVVHQGQPASWVLCWYVLYVTPWLLCRYVRKQLGFQHEQTIACGDSGNDKDMLAGPNRAIVVGNAQPDMKAWIHEVRLA